MSNRRFEMYQYRQVIVQLRQGQSLRAIAKAGLMGRNKAAKVREVAMAQGWLNLESPVPEDGTLSEIFERHGAKPAQESCIDPHKERVRGWAEQGASATVIHATLVRDHGFVGSYSTTRRFVRSLTPDTPKATVILDHKPGEAAQVDFGSGPVLVDPQTGKNRKTWFFVMTLPYSRQMYAECVYDQKIMTWLGCHRRAFEFFGGVPRKVVIDNLKSAVTKACYYDPQVQRSYAELAIGYGFLIAPCPVRDPQKKGNVESGVKYVKGNFMPLRNMKDIVDANTQLMQWLLETANTRIHGSTRRRPIDLFNEVEARMLQPLPEHHVEMASWHQAKVHGDCHVQYEKCRYSVPHIHVRETVWIKATEKIVSIYDEHNLLTSHPRCRIPGQRATNKDHYPPAAKQHDEHDVQWCLQKAERVGFYCRQVIETLFTDKVLERLRAAQGIVNFRKQYGPKRLENACQRAIHYDTVSYHAIKTMLKNGADQSPLETEKVLPLDDVFTGNSKFTRDASDFSRQEVTP